MTHLTERQKYYGERWEEFKTHATVCNSIFWQKDVYTQTESDLISYHHKLHDDVRIQVQVWTFNFNEFLEEEEYVKSTNTLRKYVKKGMGVFCDAISEYCQARALNDESAQLAALRRIEKTNTEMHRLLTSH